MHQRPFYGKKSFAVEVTFKNIFNNFCKTIKNGICVLFLQAIHSSIRITIHYYVTPIDMLLLEVN